MELLKGIECNCGSEIVIYRMPNPDRLRVAHMGYSFYSYALTDFRLGEPASINATVMLLGLSEKMEQYDVFKRRGCGVPKCQEAVSILRGL